MNDNDIDDDHQPLSKAQAAQVVFWLFVAIAIVSCCGLSFLGELVAGAE